MLRAASRRSPPARFRRALLVSILSVIGASLVAASPHALAQAGAAATYPVKPIRVVVPYPPGGTTDVLARAVGDKLTEAWGQPIVVDNRSGGAGIIGTEAVARAAPDGYTLVLGNNQTHAMNASLFDKVPFDLLRDFAPVAFVASTKHVFVVPASSGPRSLKELVAAGKSGRLAYASSSPGSASHLISETFRMQAGIDATHVPYRGVAPAVTDLLGGQVAFMAATYPSVSQHVAAGKLRALAVASGEPIAGLDAPTVKAEGFGDLAADAWFAFYAPTGTPREVVEKLNGEINRALRNPEVAQRLRGTGFEPATRSVDEMTRFHRAEVTRWGEMIRATGVRMTQ
jgi:tripartite-type tricarboxylate transporter receptor subunit TctC